jgi:hypothetical protein
VNSRRIRGPIVVLVGLLSRNAVEAPAAPVERTTGPGGELVVLRSDRFLVWDDLGSVHFGDGKGVWTTGVRLPLEHVWSVVPDGSGFLASGSLTRDAEAIILFDGQAREMRRWSISERSFELFAHNGRRWSVRKTGLVELLPDGRVGPVEPFSDQQAVLRHGSPPRVFQDGQARMFCWGADLTKLHDAPGVCARTNGERWVVPRAGSEPPIRCGQWLVARVGRDQREIVVLSLHGAVAGHRVFSTMPIAACAGPDSVVVGARKVEVAALPSLVTRWSHQSVGRRMSAVAAVDGAVAYETEEAGGVIVVPR